MIAGALGQCHLLFMGVMFGPVPLCLEVGLRCSTHTFFECSGGWKHP